MPRKKKTVETKEIKTTEYKKDEEQTMDKKDEKKEERKEEKVEEQKVKLEEPKSLTQQLAANQPIDTKPKTQELNTKVNVPVESLKAEPEPLTPEPVMRSNLYKLQKQPKFVESFKSWSIIEVSPKKKHLLIRIPVEHRPTPWKSIADKEISLLKWYLHVVNEYDQIIMNVPDELDDRKNNRITKRANMGFDFFTFAQHQLDPKDYAMVSEQLYVGRNEEVNTEKTRSKCLVGALKFEVDAQITMSDYNFAFGMIDSIELQKWFAKLDNHRSIQRPLPPNFKEVYHKTWFEPLFVNHYQLMDINNNYREVNYAHMYSLINSHINFSIDEPTRVMNQILMITRRVAGRFSMTDPLAREVIDVNVTDILQHYITTYVLSRWYAWRWTFDNSRLQFMHILDFILAPCLIKKSMMDAEDRIKMRNYVYLQFIRSIPGFNKAPGENYANMLTTSTDLLQQELNRENIFDSTRVRGRPNLNLLRAVLIEYFNVDDDDTGVGWAGNGEAHNHREQNTNTRFHRAPFIHESVFGRDLKDYTFTVLPKKMEQFRNMVDVLITLTSVWSVQRNIWEHLINVLYQIGLNLTKFLEISTNLDEYIRLLSFSPLCYQLSDLDDPNKITYIPVDEADLDKAGFSRGDEEFMAAAMSLSKEKVIRRTKVEAKPGHLVAMMMIGKFDTLEFYPNSNEVLTDGWARCQFLQDVVNWWVVVKKYIPKDRFTRRERLQYALSFVSNPMKSVFDKVFLDTTSTINQVIPIDGSRIYLTKIEYIKENVCDAQKSLFGITDEVYYNGTRDKTDTVPQFFKYTTLYDFDVTESRTIDYRTTFDLVQNREIFDVLQEGRVIKFTIPTVVRDYPLSTAHFYPLVYKMMDVGEGASRPDMEIDEVKVMYMWEDEQLNLTKYAFYRTPIFGVKIPPFILTQPARVLDYYMHTAVVYKNYELFYDFSRDKVYSHSNLV